MYSAPRPAIASCVRNTQSSVLTPVGNRVPLQLRPEPTAKSAMTIVAKDSGIIMDEARLYNLPLPLSAATEQLCAMSLAAGYHKLDDGRTSLLWEKFFGGKSLVETGTLEEESAKAQLLQVQPASAPKKILFIGLGYMGTPMALSLQTAGLQVTGWDVSLPAMDAYTAAGGKVASDLETEAKDADVVVFMTNTSLQIEAILSGGIAAALPEDATVVVCSTVAPSAISHIQSLVGKGINVVDAPVSGGPSKSATGDLTITASGDETALSKAAPVLAALAKTHLHFIRKLFTYTPADDQLEDWEQGVPSNSSTICLPVCTFALPPKHLPLPRKRAWI